MVLCFVIKFDFVGQMQDKMKVTFRVLSALYFFSLAYYYFMSPDKVPAFIAYTFGMLVGVSVMFAPFVMLGLSVYLGAKFRNNFKDSNYKLLVLVGLINVLIIIAYIIAFLNHG